jgi:Tn3 transposase DDE domain
LAENVLHDKERERCHVMHSTKLPMLAEFFDFYRPNKEVKYQNIDALFKETIDRDLIETHWRDLMQVVLSINVGKLLDYSRGMFGREPEAFVQPLLDEMLRSRAADWRDGRLVALASHTPPAPGWLVGKVMPGNWPKVNA